ncbi:MAG: V-type ATP synthase subunit B [Candidatus Heimdallarchaeota archaeon]|nr:V-type ATP synthase subunit B [Candidatus Heimdallarchaeota archaeon]
MARITVKGVSEIRGPLIVIEGVSGIQMGEYLEVNLENQPSRKGRVLAIEEERVIVLLYQGTYEIEKNEIETEFFGRTMQLFVSEDMIGRIFDSLGQPLDGLPSIYSEDYRDVNGLPINPTSRIYPRSYIETGISTIDIMNTLVRGQKLPIFTGAGLPNNKLIGQIVRQARIAEQDGSEKFAIVFGAMGLTMDDYIYFQRLFKETGTLNKVIMFSNLASDSAAERLLTPRVALTTAEYLAFDKGYQVLVILSDITNYCQALREISVALETVPSRKGFPGYMYSDLASIYERAGIVENSKGGSKGSITMLANLTMPNDDITHPIADLTGYITEGQIILDRSMHNKGIYPPIDVLGSLSRLMKDGIGEGFTRKDHPSLSDQLYASYAEGLDKRRLAEVIGRKELNRRDQILLSFADKFEETFVNQGDEHRTIEESLALGWSLLSQLPETELTKISGELIKTYMTKSEEEIA